MKPFRILYVLTEPFGVGGVQSDILSLAPYFVSHGHEVFVACPSGIQDEKLVATGAVHLPLSVHFRSPRQLKESISRLRTLIEKVQPNVLAPQSLRSSLAIYFAARDLPLYRITTIHNIHTTFNYVFAGKLLDICSDFVIFESTHEFRMLSRLGLSREKTTIIPSGVDTDQFFRTSRQTRLIEAEWGIPEGAFLFGCVARLSPEKAHSDLFHAFNAVLKTLPDAHLLLVGDGPLEDSLRELARFLGISRNVHFLGHRSNVRDFLNLMDVFVLASHRESLPRAAREAMACGKPIVATSVGATREVVQPNVNGFLVPPKNPASLSEAMLKIALNATLREEMGQAGERLVRQRFSNQVWSEKNEELYVRASNGKPRIGAISALNMGVP